MSNSVNKLFEESFKKHWNKPALSNFKGMTLTYGDMAKRIELLHLAFEHCGLVRGDKVAICARNQANWGVSYLAALTYGAVPVPLLHEFKPDNIHYLVNHSEAKVLFVDDVIWEGLSEEAMPDLKMIIQVNTLRYLFGIDEQHTTIREDVIAEFRAKYPDDSFGPDSIHYFEDKPDDLALINYTSGTSGFSKGVMIPFRALYANIMFAGTTAEPQMNSDSEVVSMLPAAHMYGMMFEFLFEMTIGAHVHYLTRLPSPKVILGAMQDVKPSIIISVPLILEKVYKSKLKPIMEKNKTFLKLPVLNQIIYKKMKEGLVEAFGGRFEEAIIGGAAFNPEVEAALAKIHFPFTVGYGMTECAPLITYAHWNEARLLSCGKPITGCEVRIDSPDPQNVAGEVQVKGDIVFLGYYKNEEATAAAFTEDGWFRTGDMGVMDKDGYLYLRGRLKCMILSANGQNIYPEELEAVINNVMYVIDSLVIDEAGSLVALIYPDYQQGEADGLSKEQLEAKILDALPVVNKELPNYAQIKKIEFLPEDFERTPKRSIKRYLYQRG